MFDRKEIIDQVELVLDQPTGDLLNILIVIDKLQVIGGLETYIYNLCKELLCRGHNVKIVCTAVCSNLKKFFSFVEIFERETIQGMAEIVQKYSLNLIHLHSDESLGKGLLLHHITNVPLVITWHGAYYFENFPQIAEAAQKIMCVSEEAADILASQYPAAGEKIVVVQNGVDVREFRPDYYDKPSGEITFIGRVGEDRSVGLKTLIESFLQTSFNRLNVVGLTNIYNNLSNPRINFAGEVENVREYLTKADVVVGTGRGVREAMACGKPCIVMSNWGYDGIVYPGTKRKMEYANFSGRGICQTLSVNSLMKDLEILKCRELRERLGAYGRFLAETEYNNENITDKIELIYKQALNNFYSTCNTSKISKCLIFEQSCAITADCTVNSHSESNLDNDPIYLGGFNSTIYRYFAHADLMEFSSNNQILKAEFQIFCIRNDGINQQIDLHWVVEHWDEKNILWSNLPLISKVPSASGIAGDTYCWISFDVTGLVRQWFNKSIPNHGICLKLKYESGKLIAGFNRHYLNRSARPRVVVHYSV